MGANKVTTYAAILINDFTVSGGTQSKTVTPGAITTSSALLTTTSTSIKLTFATDPEYADVELTVYGANNAVVATGSALDGKGSIEVDLETAGVYTFELVVNSEAVKYTAYTPTTYKFIVEVQ